MQELRAHCMVLSLPPHKTVGKTRPYFCTAEMIEGECKGGKDNSVVLSSSDMKKGKRAKIRGKHAMSRISIVSI